LNAPLALLGQLGGEIANCFDETFGTEGTLGRETSSEMAHFYSLQDKITHKNMTFIYPDIV